MQADGIFDKYADTSADTIGPEGDTVPCQMHSPSLCIPALFIGERIIKQNTLTICGTCAGVERFCTDLGLDPSDKRVSIPNRSESRI